MKTIGIWLAQAILTLTGNLALAASLRSLPVRLWLPLRLTVQDKSAHLEYPFGPEDWAGFRHQSEQDYPSKPMGTLQQAAE